MVAPAGRRAGGKLLPQRLHVAPGRHGRGLPAGRPVGGAPGRGAQPREREE